MSDLSNVSPPVPSEPEAAQSRFQELDADDAAPEPPPPADDPELDGDDAPAAAYHDGDLPDFSDDEAPSSAATSTSRLPPPRPKGVLGRKKMPPVAKKLVPASLLNGHGATPKKGSKAEKAEKKAEKEKEKEQAVDTGDEPGALSEDAALQKLMASLVVNTPGSEQQQIQTVDIQTFMKQMGINNQYLSGKRGLMGKGTKDMASHKFWSTQPVVKLGTPIEEIREGPLEPNKPLEEIKKEPLELHKDFRWDTLDITDPVQLKEVYDLLSSHYVEDPDASFRFAYEASFIEWALKPPGYVPDWHIGIRVAATGKLVGFIAGIPLDLRIRAVTKRFTEINFLCVHKKLRSKRLAPLLIQEVTRRTHLRGIFQAIYTAGVFLPTPITRCQYYHRSLNPKKLVETGFSSMPRNMTMARMLRHYKLPEATALPGLRELEKRDLKQISRLLRAFLARMDLAPLLSNKDVEHALLAGRGKDVDGKRVGQVTWTYVVEDPETHRITDMFSFYSLPSTAVKAKTPTLINAAYLFYYATTACPSCADLGDGSVATPIVHWKDETPEQRQVLKDRLKVLVTDAMILAHKNGFDVLNALTLQDNALFLEDLKFGKGDGFLHYYLYNYSTKPMEGGIDTSDGGSGVGVVML